MCQLPESCNFREVLLQSFQRELIENVRLQFMRRDKAMPCLYRCLLPTSRKFQLSGSFITLHSQTKQKQMKHLASLILALLSFIGVFANPVDDSTAKAVGLNFLAFKVNSQKLGIVSDLKLAYKASDENANACFYVFNTTSAKGFVIVSADDNAKPILGYSDESNFDTTNMPIQLKEWFGGYAKQISAIIKNKTIATDDIKSKWQELKTPPSRKKFEEFGITTFGTPVVAPLIQTKWDQDAYWNGSTGLYNALCPYDYTKDSLTLTGCGATAMAQVLKYWNYPFKGTGFNSYTPKSNPYLGVQSVNFGNTTYQWNSMPLQLTSSSTTAQINAVATLMYHCGVSINMDYDVEGSSSYIVGASKYHPIDTALLKYFGYDSSLAGISRSKYTNSNWINLIEAELNAKRPVIYQGESNSDGHLFVADGYDINNYIHFNWGWSGTYNGYYSIDSLVDGYDYSQHAIIGIQPSQNKVVNDIRLYTNVTPSDTTISYGDSLFIHTNVVNRSTTTFSGDFCAALFDTASKFVDYIQILSAKTLKPSNHYTNGLTFATNQRFNFVPGKYTVEVFYRPTGGNWLKVSDTLGYVNKASLTILGDLYDSLEMYAPLKTTPTILTQGMPDTISFNVVNRASTTFTGQFSAILYNLDGTFAQLIGTHTTTSGLKTGYHYTNGITFHTNSINVNPGTYLLVIQDSITNGYWRLTGCGKYTNPVIVSVQPATLTPDIYEPNDNIGRSYLLKLNFTNNLGYANTTGSNINVGTDNDFYKIKLPKGYNYTISPILNNESYSRTDSIYSLNGIFSMSVDSINWSATYQDTLPQPIIAKGGQTIFFHVAPYFEGLTGTYLLEVNVTRTSTVPVTLNSFEAEKKDKAVQLNWQTATELNTSHFIIQRSTDGSSFTDIGTVKAIGSGANSYSFTDCPPAPQKGVLYYRLQMVGKDGSLSFSKIVSASLAINDSRFTIYPNPAKDNVTIKGNHISSVQVIDNMGRVVKGVSLKDASDPVLSVSSLAAGVYHVRIQTTDGNVSGNQLMIYN